MRFKRENWQPTIGDKYILVVDDEKAYAYDMSDSKKLATALHNDGFSHAESVVQSIAKPPVFTAGYLGIQASSKYIIEQYRKAKKEYKYDGTVVGETIVELLKGKQPICRYGDE